MLAPTTPRGHFLHTNISPRRIDVVSQPRLGSPSRVAPWQNQRGCPLQALSSQESFQVPALSQVAGNNGTSPRGQVSPRLLPKPQIQPGSPLRAQKVSPRGNQSGVLSAVALTTEDASMSFKGPMTPAVKSARGLGNSCTAPPQRPNMGSSAHQGLALHCSVTPRKFATNLSPRSVNRDGKCSVVGSPEKIDVGNKENSDNANSRWPRSPRRPGAGAETLVKLKAHPQEGLSPSLQSKKEFRTSCDARQNISVDLRSELQGARDQVVRQTVKLAEREMYIAKLEETRKDHAAQLAEKEKALAKKQQEAAEFQSKLRLKELEEHTLSKQKECSSLQERCANLEAQNNELQQRLNHMHRKPGHRDKREPHETDSKSHASKQSSGQKPSRERLAPQAENRKDSGMVSLGQERQAQHTQDSRNGDEKWRGSQVWSNGVFDTKKQAPVEMVIQNLAQNIREGILGACVQGAPCSGIDTNNEQDVSNEMHQSVGEVCIAEFASPRPQNRSRPNYLRAGSPGVGLKRVDGNAPLAAVPMQISSTQRIEAVTVSENSPQDESVFVDDVKLRADALQASRSSRLLAKDVCFKEDGDEVPACLPHPSGGSPRNDRFWVPRHADESPVADDVIADLNHALQGLPADASGFGESLEESMMGASVDESVCVNGFSVPDLPIPRLGESRAPASPGLPSEPQAPPRTIFFPPPPVNSSPLVYHSGHFQGWSQRCSKRGSSPSS